MMNFLKKLFQSEPRPMKITNIEARLNAADGGRMHGELEYEAYDNGQWELEIDIEHMGPAPNGPLDIRIDGRSLMSLPVSQRGNDTEVKLSSRRGDTLSVTPAIGMSVEVRNATGVLLTGTFAADY